MVWSTFVRARSLVVSLQPPQEMLDTEISATSFIAEFRGAPLS
jgi:hypothetical protein